MRKQTVLIAAVVAGLPAAALAQDFGVDWTGPYLGGSIGYAVVNSHAKFTDTSFIVGPGVPISSVPINATPSGLIGSLQLGGNQQFGHFVLGGEAELGVGSITTTFPDPLIGRLGGGPGAPVAGDTVTAGSDVAGSLLLRAGLGVGNFLPYATAGVTTAHAFTTATAGGGDDNGWLTGWSLGTGVEMAVADQVSVRVQYLHTDLSGPNFNRGKFYESSQHPVSDSISLGVNYRF